MTDAKKPQDRIQLPVVIKISSEVVMKRQHLKKK